MAAASPFPEHDDRDPGRAGTEHEHGRPASTPAVIDPFGGQTARIPSAHGTVWWSSWLDFRAQDARRIGPCEVDYGSQWQGAKLDLPWRVVWLEGTGEVIAIQWSADGDGGAAGPVELLAVGMERVAVDTALKDWWHMCGHVGSLDWVKRRLATALPGTAP